MKKPIKFFCVVCGKEIWQKMSEEMKATTTIKEAEETAVCWDCVTTAFPQTLAKKLNPKLAELSI